MDIEQASKTIQWLDDERRKDHDLKHSGSPAQRLIIATCGGQSSRSLRLPGRGL